MERTPRKSGRRFLILSASLLIALVFGLAAGTGGAAAADAAAFYKGKNLVFICPYTPGGGYDTYSRLLTPFLEKYLGTRVIVKNLPGGGGMLGVNELYTAPTNGLTIGIQNAVASVTNQLSEIKGVRYDMTKFSWIGRIQSDLRVLSMRKDTPYKTVEDLIGADKPVKLGATGLGGSTYVDAVIVREALGLNLEIIHGYDTSPQIDLGMMRGEIEGTWGSYGSRLSMVESGEQFLILQNPHKRDPRVPDVPTSYEFVKTEKGKRLLDTLLAMHDTGRPVAAPPGVPADRLAFLRDGFRKAMHDPEFLALAEKSKRELSYLSGEEMAELAKTALEIPEEDIKQVFVKAIKGEI